ncbi:TPA: hypothetical protein IW703_001044 [Enterococcus faecium]|uniref:Uncharacterized protein n=1 Tax=Enterococcus faecium TaxID=1352 RepID=A0A1L2HW38_ENTFC|nr:MULTISPECIES: hypothetical protein [Enterococcus]ANB93149.1 hypothetical protein XM37_02985 [Enterococcus faecium]AOM22871.1 hypothetical protein AL016_11055 [Enterococcus faecium]AOM29148.1 hypothetical protein AL018_12185 [Enterococcus faecium]AOM31418.1 hypothetical protein AL020_08455 [Enterococcus faecium]AOM37642.1 hypothetical protein AL024_08085 [Enterococcus faecium]
MRKKRPFLLFWLFGFFLLLILSAAFSGKMTADLAQKETEKIVASKESVDNFKKEFSTYWWAEYKITANYEKGELDIYLPKGKEENQFINIDDVLSAISLRQYQFKDKHLTVLLLTHDGDKVARLITAYSEKVDKKVVADRLAEWKKTNEQVKKTTVSSQKNESTGTSPSDSGSGQTITGSEENQASIITNESSQGQYQSYGQ